MALPAQGRSGLGGQGGAWKRRGIRARRLVAAGRRRALGLCFDCLAAQNRSHVRQIRTHLVMANRKRRLRASVVGRSDRARRRCSGAFRSAVPLCALRKPCAGEEVRAAAPADDQGADRASSVASSTPARTAASSVPVAAPKRRLTLPALPRRFHWVLSLPFADPARTPSRRPSQAHSAKSENRYASVAADANFTGGPRG